MNLSGPWIRRPVMTTLVMGGMLVFGVVSYRQLPVADLPPVDYPTISVSANLSGASPETMAASVATPLEKQFSTIAGLDAITSSSSQGSTNITLQFDLDRDIDGAALDVQAALVQAQRGMPRDMLPPTFRKVDPSSASIILYALTSATLPLSALDNYAQTTIGQRLSTISGVAQLQVFGSQKYAVRIQLDPQALAARKIGLDEVVTAITTGNANLPTGILYGTDKAFSVKADGQLHNAEEFRQLAVTWRDGKPVRLGDLGHVVDSVQDIRSAAWFGTDGKIDRGIILAIQRQPGTNTVTVAEAVRAEMKKIAADLPASVKVSTMYDRSISIGDSVNDVKFTLYLTLGLVVLVIFLFLRNVSATVIPSLALPMSLLGTFAVMNLLGYSLDNLSLMALTLSVGFVVDDAIVMLENIMRHVEAGQDPHTASVEGSAEIGFTILSMTLSLTAVFIPIIFLGGLIGRLFREFAVTIGVAILVSGFISVTLTPMLCSRFLRVGHRGDAGDTTALGGIFRFTEAIYQRTLAAYGRALTWVMARRRATFAFSGLVLIGTIALARFVPKGFIPSEDTNSLRVTTETIEGTSYEGMYRHQLEAMKVVSADSNVAGFMSSVGGGNQGRFQLRLVDRSQRPLSSDDVARQLSRKLGQIPGLRAFVQNPPPINIGGRMSKSQYQFTLFGANIDELYRTTAAMELRLKDLPELADVTSDLQIKNPQIRVAIDRERASASGISMNEVQSALYNAYGARQVSTIYTDDNQYSVVLELLPQYQRDLSALSLLSISGRGGQLVPVTALAHVTEGVGPLSVNHTGQLPSVTLSFNVAQGVSIGEAVTAVNRLARDALPVGISGRFAGTAQAFQDAQTGLLVLLGLAIIVIYIVLGILYESFIHPLTIFSGLPFAGFGALLALVVFNFELSIYAFVGVIMLIGLVKKNAIMMIDFAVVAERDEGLTAAEAIHKACMVRFRPIMMTTMAALMGTLPIALAVGAGAESRRPLGIAVVGGLAVSQLITLFVTPVVYVFFDGLRSRRALTGARTLGEPRSL